MFSVLVIRLRSLRLLRVSGIVMRLRMFLLLITFLKDRKSGSAGMPRPTSYAVFCLKKKYSFRNEFTLGAAIPSSPRLYYIATTIRHSILYFRCPDIPPHIFLQ